MDPKKEYVRCLVFPIGGRADLKMVQADEDKLRKMALEGCQRKYRDQAEVVTYYPPGGGLMVFYPVPKKESGIGERSRWHCEWGSGSDEFLLGPAFMVAANTVTGDIRDFTAREFNRALGFDKDNYRHEKMLDISVGEQIAVSSGGIPYAGKTDRIFVESQNWQLLTVRIETGAGVIYTVIPKSRILEGELEIIRYENAEIIR